MQSAKAQRPGAIGSGPPDRCGRAPAILMATPRQHRIPLAINGRFLTQATTGVQRVAREISREIDALVAAGEADFDVRLLCQRDADLGDLRFRAIRVERIGHAVGHGWEQLALPAAARGAVLLCLGNTAPVWSLLSGSPVAVMVHDLSYRYFPDAYRYGYRLGHRLLTPLLLRRANPIFTVSETERTMLVRHDPTLAQRIVLTRNGGWRDAPEAPPRKRWIPPDQGYILYVGAFSQRKNFDGVLTTAIRLAREDGIRSMFVGSRGSILSPSAMEIPSDVQGLLSFAGQFEKPEQLADAYAHASCLLFPSLYEASPLPPVEAMHFGCPVIGSDIPSMRERCGDAAEYCDPHDSESIIAAARRVLRNPARAEQLIALGHVRAQRYSWHAQARIVLDEIRRKHPDRRRGSGSVRG